MQERSSSTTSRWRPSSTSESLSSSRTEFLLQSSSLNLLLSINSINSSSLRLTWLEDELLNLARTMGPQQTSLEQLELELEAEEGGVKKGQR